MPAKPYVVALEEHYSDPEVKPHFEGLGLAPAPRVLERLDDVGPLPHRRDGRGRHRHPGAVARRSGLQSSTRSSRCGWRRRQRPARRDGARPSRPLRRFRHAADPRSERGRRRARTRGHPARLQGRDGQRADRQPVSSTTSGSGRSSSGRRRSMCRSTCTPRSRTRRSSRPTTRITSNSIPRCCAPPGVSRSRPRRRASAWC